MYDKFEYYFIILLRGHWVNLYNAYTVDVCINLTSVGPAQKGDGDLSPPCV